MAAVTAKLPIGSSLPRSIDDGAALVDEAAGLDEVAELPLLLDDDEFEALPEPRRADSFGSVLKLTLTALPLLHVELTLLLEPETKLTAAHYARAKSATKAAYERKAPCANPPGTAARLARRTRR
jgi:hypothetical protein